MKYTFALRAGGSFSLEGDSIELSGGGRFFVISDEDGNITGGVSAEDIISFEGTEEDQQ